MKSYLYANLRYMNHLYHDESLQSIKCLNKFPPFFIKNWAFTYCERTEPYVLFEVLSIVLFFLSLARILIQ